MLFEGRPENATEHAALKKLCSEDLDIFMKEGLLIVGESSREYFNSSICKNTAHQMAIDFMAFRPDPGAQQSLLVNLDCDNVIYGEWLSSLAQQLSDARDVVSWKFSGEDGGCTGRIGVDMDTFIGTKGYCQQLPFPAGTQDAE